MTSPTHPGAGAAARGPGLRLEAESSEGSRRPDMALPARRLAHTHSRTCNSVMYVFYKKTFTVIHTQQHHLQWGKDLRPPWTALYTSEFFYTNSLLLLLSLIITDYFSEQFLVHSKIECKVQASHTRSTHTQPPPSTSRPDWTRHTPEASVCVGEVHSVVWTKG